MAFFELGYLDNSNRSCLINIDHVVSVEIKPVDTQTRYRVLVQLVAGEPIAKVYNTLQDAENAFNSIENAITNGKLEKAVL